jgi:predicted acyltransferase
VLQRIGTLFVVGLLLNAFGSNPWDKWPHWHFRIMGCVRFLFRPAPNRR